MARRDPSSVYQTPVQLTMNHAATTTTFTTDIYVVPAGRTLVIDRCEYIPEASLATSGSSFVNVEVLNGASTVAANVTTQTSQTNTQALAAGVTNPMGLSTTPANLSVPGGTAVRLSLVCTSAPAVGAGLVRVEGRLQ